jgi:hypothetical protein
MPQKTEGGEGGEGVYGFTEQYKIKNWGIFQNENNKIIFFKNNSKSL